MAKMLDGPVPDGARSVSWPWYHHILTNELTADAKKLLTVYSGVPPDELEAHIYSTVGFPSPFEGGSSRSDVSETKLGASFPGRVSVNSGS